ncbi:MAG: acyl-CoA dehydrogenase [Polyangiaceae bacterium]|nr:acyl-CoA dehydrogenase [Polyangiaceae bacterium]
MANPLIRDRLVDFLLNEVLHVSDLCDLPEFEDYSTETFDLLLDSVRKLARGPMFETYREMNDAPAHFDGKRVITSERMKDLYPRLVELGMTNATRPKDAGGQQLPCVIMGVCAAYLSAANVSATCFATLSIGAGHLIEAFGSHILRERYMAPIYSGEWTGTMALTEPHAGSSLGDVATKALPTDGEHYLISGSKIFISGGDNSFSENIVHLALARIEGAPAGIRGISLFVVPAKRLEGTDLVDNDVTPTGTFHKMGWRALPSIALTFGEAGDCHGYLVGEPHRGMRYMFQMMNEARIGVGLHAAATALVAYEESLAYAKERPQGRALKGKADGPQVNIIEHADVRRMLLRQKAISESAFALVLICGQYMDLSRYATEAAERERAEKLLELLTPVTKTFAAEQGFESNALAVQVLGGAGYTSEYLPEAWLRDQKLNSIHEGTTGIQSLDLLARKVFGTGGASLVGFAKEIALTIEAGKSAGVEESWLKALETATADVGELSQVLGMRAMADAEAGMRHSHDYLDMFGTLVIGWVWVRLATAASRGIKNGGARADKSFYDGQLRCAQYWFANEMPRVKELARRIEVGDDSYAAMDHDSF